MGAAFPPGLEKTSLWFLRVHVEPRATLVPSTHAQPRRVRSSSPRPAEVFAGVGIISFINTEDSEHYRGVRGENKVLHIICALQRTKP